jgi:hypothetical protein
MDTIYKGATMPRDSENIGLIVGADSGARGGIWLATDC